MFQVLTFTTVAAFTLKMAGSIMAGMTGIIQVTGTRYAQVPLNTVGPGRVPGIMEAPLPAHLQRVRERLVLS